MARAGPPRSEIAAVWGLPVCPDQHSTPPVGRSKQVPPYPTASAVTAPVAAVPGAAEADVIGLPTLQMTPPAAGTRQPSVRSCTPLAKAGTTVNVAGALVPRHD